MSVCRYISNPGRWPPVEVGRETQRPERSPPAAPAPTAAGRACRHPRRKRACQPDGRCRSRTWLACQDTMPGEGSLGNPPMPGEGSLGNPPRGRIPPRFVRFRTSSLNPCSGKLAGVWLSRAAATDPMDVNAFILSASTGPCRSIAVLDFRPWSIPVCRENGLQAAAKLKGGGPVAVLNGDQVTAALTQPIEFSQCACCVLLITNGRIRSHMPT